MFISLCLMNFHKMCLGANKSEARQLGNNRPELIEAGFIGQLKANVYSLVLMLLFLEECWCSSVS